jgi:hypothetical protein
MCYYLLSPEKRRRFPPFIPQHRVPVASDEEFHDKYYQLPALILSMALPTPKLALNRNEAATQGPTTTDSNNAISGHLRLCDADF